MKSSRTYTLDKRAQQQEQTRTRIVEAVVALHEEVGPARTTVVAIAERARVSRPTVYSHFPDEASLITACSAHWAALNPRPDPTDWSGNTAPPERLRFALDGLYGYYASQERMLTNVLRDAGLVPSLKTALEASVGRYVETATQVLAAGWGGSNRNRHRLLAALGLALDFQTWQSLTGASGLSHAEAVELMAGLVESTRTQADRAGS